MVTKKKHAVFKVPNYGAKNRKGVPERWRKPRGIDSKIRVEKKGHGATPKVGYKNHASVRFARKDGMFEHLVHNENDLLAIHGDKTRVAVLAHDLSRRTRESLQKTADAKGIRIVNRIKVEKAKAPAAAKAAKQQAAAPVAAATEQPPKADAAVKKAHTREGAPEVVKE